MLDQNFLTFLEYEISKVFDNTPDEEFRGFWCDGLLLSEPEQDYSIKYVNDNRLVVLKAFLGKDGQTEYKVLLHFGNKTLSRYARGLSLQECLPCSDWFSIDINKKTVEIYLD